MNETAIAWTNLTWNPFSGCEAITAGCKFCYAKTLAEQKRGTPAFPNGFDLTLRPHKLKEPSKVKEPSLIFVNSMSDFAWEKVSDAERDKVVDQMEIAYWHEYQVLTKRADNLLRYSKRRKLPRNFWAGVTIEGPATHARLDALKQVDCEITFVSAEPLLGDLAPSLDLSGISWLISGGESGKHMNDPDIRDKRGLVNYDAKAHKWTPREDRADWVRHLRDDCAKSGTKHFFKQWGGYFPHSGGRLLDGQTHDEYPRLPSAAKAPGFQLVGG